MGAVVGPLELELLVFLSGPVRPGHGALFRAELTASPPDDLAVNAAASRLAARGLLAVNRNWIPGDEGRPIGLTIHGSDYLDQLLRRLAVCIPAARGRWHLNGGLLKDLWPEHGFYILGVANALLGTFARRATH